MVHGVSMTHDRRPPTRFTLRLPPGLAASTAHAAEVHETSISEFVRTALRVAVRRTLLVHDVPADLLVDGAGRPRAPLKGAP